MADRPLKAFEAISLIATGRSVPYADRHVLFRCTISTWGVFWFDYIRRTEGRALTLFELSNAFEARSTFDQYPQRIRGTEFDFNKPYMEVSGPCCLWAPVCNGGTVTQNPTRFYDEASSPNGPKKLWRIALRMRRYLCRPVTYADLAFQLKADIAADSRTEYSLQDATYKIRRAIFEGRLRAFGLSGVWFGRKYLSNLPTQIPSEFFANHRNTLTIEGWAALDPLSSSPDEWRDPNTKSWGDVWFYQSEIECLVAQSKSEREPLASPASLSENTIPAGADPKNTPLARARRKSPGLDYRAADAPLVAEALAGMAAGAYRNATDAARALASRAVGTGTANSKVTRLIGRITAAGAVYSDD